MLSPMLTTFEELCLQRDSRLRSYNIWLGTYVQDGMHIALCPSRRQELTGISRYVKRQVGVDSPSSPQPTAAIPIATLPSASSL